MGDRRNVVVRHSDQHSVALYTHWSGSELPGVLAAALDRGRGRWGDPIYLTRIIFSEMIQGEVMSETGYGIEPFATGSDWYCEASPGYDLTVDYQNQTVSGDDHGSGETSSFEDFIFNFR